MTRRAYLPALEAAAQHRLPMLCVNPDRHVMVGGERLICAGALADLYKPMCGDIFEVGKPDPAVYDPVLEILGIDRPPPRGGDRRHAAYRPGRRRRRRGWMRSGR